ncbi:hypothetical protein ACWD6I_27070, partial [Streptomyces sp. NPDC002454]
MTDPTGQPPPADTRPTAAAAGVDHVTDAPHTDPGYLRFPHLHGDLLAFVAEDDLWVAPLH